MVGTHGGEVVVLSADEAFFERVSRIWLSGWPLLRWMCDPLALEGLGTVHQGDVAHDSDRRCPVLGVILDLTTPSSSATGPQEPQRMHSSTGTRQIGMHADTSPSQWLAWHLGATLAAVSCGADVPLLLSSCDPDLEPLLRHRGARLIGRIEPTDSDATWRRDLSRLYAHIAHLRADRDTPAAASKSDDSPYLLHLAHHLRYDRARRVLMREGKEVSLTGREVALLAALAEAPNTFRLASDLARRLSNASRYTVDDHSVEQTICKLRRKLGESAQDASVLVGRRGLGYALRIGEAAQYVAPAPQLEA